MSKAGASETMQSDFCVVVSRPLQAVDADPEIAVGMSLGRGAEALRSLHGRPDRSGSL